MASGELEEKSCWEDGLLDERRLLEPPVRNFHLGFEWEITLDCE